MSTSILADNPRGGAYFPNAQSRIPPSQASSIPLPHSAVRNVLELPELRFIILECLEQSDLLRLMRVNKVWMGDVAKRIYRSISFRRLQSPLSECRIRNVIYINAVYAVHAYCDDISPTYDLQLNMGYITSSDPTRRRAFLERYHPMLCQIIHTAVRSICPGVRQIHYGGAKNVPFAPAFWIIYPEPSKWTVPTSPTDRPIEVVYSGSVSLHHTLTISLHSIPDDWTLREPPSPRDNHLKQRFDVRFSSHPPEPGTTQINRNTAWLNHIREDPRWADIWRSVDFADLPITMEDLTLLYRKQIASGHKDRLRVIIAPRIVPWSITDLTQLVHLAGPTLDALFLTKGPFSQQTLLTFGQLAPLITIIQHDLPNLRALKIAMAGSRESEAICKDLLRDDSLEKYGRLTRLSIITDSIPSTPFNLVRALLSICSVDVMVTISNGELSAGAAITWASERQTQYIRYLRNQPPYRRHHLSIVDFKSLLLGDLDDVRSLEYKADGRPLINKAAFRLQSKACISECGRILEVASRLLPDMDGSLWQRADIMSGIASRMAQADSVFPEIMELEREAQAMTESISATRAALIARLGVAGSDQVRRALSPRLDTIMSEIVESCRAIMEESEDRG